ncbi:MAG: uracil-DNA glycosylase [bacterium]|nr:uracil-DNA glycosylase [bacterium]
MNVITEILEFYKEIGVEFVEQEQKNPSIEMNKVNSEITSCTKCPLHKDKKNYVPGEGPIDPKIMFIGEGPGETEDSFGKPFIGKAGQLLDKVIGKMGYSRETVFVGNIVKCRPPHNRDPLPDEVAACMPYLERQIAILSPKVIVCLGKVPMNNLLGTSNSIMKERGKVFDFRGIPLIPTYHPAYILHLKEKEAVSKAKWDMWNDMQKAMAMVGK